jgi:hypothetical protein
VCFGSFAALLKYLSMSAIRPISDLQFEVANTETGVIQAPNNAGASPPGMTNSPQTIIKPAAIRIWPRAYESTP